MYPSLRSVLRYKILVQTFKEMYESVYHYYRENVDCQCQQSQWPLKRCFRIALRQSDFSIFMKNGLIPSSGKKSGDQCNNSVCHIFRFLSEFSFTAIHCISANNFKKINCNSHLCCPYFSKILSGYIQGLTFSQLLFIVSAKSWFDFLRGTKGIGADAFIYAKRFTRFLRISVICSMAWQDTYSCRPWPFKPPVHRLGQGSPS